MNGAPSAFTAIQYRLYSKGHLNIRYLDGQRFVAVDQQQAHQLQVAEAQGLVLQQYSFLLKGVS